MVGDGKLRLSTFDSSSWGPTRAADMLTPITMRSKRSRAKRSTTQNSSRVRNRYTTALCNEVRQTGNPVVMTSSSSQPVDDGLHER